MEWPQKGAEKYLCLCVSCAFLRQINIVAASDELNELFHTAAAATQGTLPGCARSRIAWFFAPGFLILRSSFSPVLGKNVRAMEIVAPFVHGRKSRSNDKT
jgi:hypothetical protein